VAVLGEHCVSGTAPAETIKEVHTFERFTLSIRNPPENSPRDDEISETKIQTDPPTVDQKKAAEVKVVLDGLLCLLEHTLDDLHALTTAIKADFGADFLQGSKPKVISAKNVIGKIVDLVQGDLSLPEEDQIPVAEKSSTPVPSEQHLDNFLCSLMASGSPLSLLDGNSIKKIEVNSEISVPEEPARRKTRKGSHFLTRFDAHDLTESSDICDPEVDFFQPIKFSRPVPALPPQLEKKKPPIYPWLGAEKDPNLITEVKTA